MAARVDGRSTDTLEQSESETGEFQIGDKVCWTTNTSGTGKTKVGTVIAEVEPGKSLDDLVNDGTVDPEQFNNWNRLNHRHTRTTPSYLVAVTTQRRPNSRPRKSAFWPYAHWLTHVAPPITSGSGQG